MSEIVLQTEGLTKYFKDKAAVNHLESKNSKGLRMRISWQKRCGQNNGDSDDDGAA